MPMPTAEPMLGFGTSGFLNLGMVLGSTGIQAHTFRPAVSGFSSLEEEEEVVVVVGDDVVARGEDVRVTCFIWIIRLPSSIGRIVLFKNLPQTQPTTTKSKSSPEAKNSLSLSLT